MNPIYGKALIIFGLVLTIIIRVPHENKKAKIKVVKSHKTPLETALIAIIAIGMMLLPVLAIFTPLLAFADYSLSPVAFALGVVMLIGNLYLFYRSHLDLGANFSPTLEIREGHKLVTKGVYQTIRNPMYTSIFFYGLAQMLLLPNWIAGPAGFIAIAVLFVLRVRFEEKMMIEEFGDEYIVYMQKTKRLLPGIY